MLVENPGFPFKTRGFQQNRVRPSGNAAQTAKYSHLTRISRICYTFSGIFFHVWCRPMINPWLTRDYPTETLGLDRETFGKTPWFSKPVTKPWWTHDIPVKLNAGWMPQNSILFWLVFVVFSWNRSGLCLLVFGNKAPLLDGSKKVTWPELPNPEFCLKTLGFPAGPANFSGFVG